MYAFFRDPYARGDDERFKAYGSFATTGFRRCVGLHTSADFVQWAGHSTNPILEPLGGASECIHDILVWPEAGQYVGLLQVGDALHNYAWEWISSRNGVDFSRAHDGLAVLTSGDEGTWDAGGVSLPAPVRVGDEWWFYYGAFERPWSAYPAAEAEIWCTRMHCGLATMKFGR